MTNAFRASALVSLLLAGAALASGCAASPNRDTVAERFAIELAAGMGEPEDWQDLALILTDDALSGRCGDDQYRAGLGDDPGLIYAWSATCLMYFEADLTDAQLDRAKQDLVDFTSTQIDG